jgi:hypothetical protein
LKVSLCESHVEFGLIPSGEGLGEHERLERGARLALALRGEVERLGRVVVAADHRAHLAVAVVEHHHRRARPAVHGSHCWMARWAASCELDVERRLDRQATLERLTGADLAAAELVDHLLADPRGEVAVLRGPPAAAGRRRGRGSAPPPRWSYCSAADVALLEHALENEVPAGLGGLRVLQRVERARRLHDAGQQRASAARAGRRTCGARATRKPGGWGLEVRRGGGLDPVGAVAEVDRVEVVAQDPLLGPLVRDLVGQRRLAQLVEQRALLLGGERDLDELLRDRGAALDGLLGAHVLPQGARDAAQVDAVVGVEAAILDRDDRLLHHRRDVRGLDHDAALVAGQQAQRLAVHVLDLRVLPRRLLELGRPLATAIIIPNTVESAAMMPSPNRRAARATS